MNNLDINHAGSRDVLDTMLDQLVRRQRWNNIVRCAARGFILGTLIGVGAAIILLVLRDPIMYQWRWLVIGVLPLAALLGGVVGLFLPIDRFRLARAFDRAAGSEDRFASALQLALHARPNRARLVRDDASKYINRATPSVALPLRLPKHTRWAIVPLLAIVAVIFVAPQPTAGAADVPPEITAEQWAQLADEFNNSIEELPNPETPEEEALRRKLDELATLLSERPDKKDVLREIAKMEESIRKQREKAAGNTPSMKDAAKKATRSEMLKKIAEKMRQGEYKNAADMMKQLAEQLKSGETNPSASEFENISSDLQKMAQELASAEELQKAAQQGADAASKMNRQALAEALKRLSDEMNNSATRARQMDNLDEMKRLLEQLKRQMNQKSQCKNCNGEGCSQCQGQGNRPGWGSGLVKRPGAGRGGLKAGIGTAAKWDGGALGDGQEAREASVADAQERSGESSSIPTISPDERANSGLTYEQMYAEFVQKAEADLELDDAPVAYREFLRRYFNSIRPDDDSESNSGAADDSSSPQEPGDEASAPVGSGD